MMFDGGREGGVWSAQTPIAQDFFGGLSNNIELDFQAAVRARKPQTSGTYEENDVDRLNAAALDKKVRQSLNGIAGFLYKLGMITKPIPVTVQRGDLISKWIRQTTETTRTKINETKGGVMLIDEAYQLAQSDTSKRDVGRESLEELMSVMEGGDPIMITLWGTNSVYHLPVVSPG
ncbi:Hypp6756 [Branchiostoma lanceolatum]|uniref:Hypp6756 protein n=1 Tax=Branchiostoma lanceolatum TaxID=7740 RepID=A0A8J9YVH8_BRALA|nr:Hypp6756 [Branchiostoma lanceolatum]